MFWCALWRCPASPISHSKYERRWNSLIRLLWCVDKYIHWNHYLLAQKRKTVVDSSQHKTRTYHQINFVLNASECTSFGKRNFNIYLLRIIFKYQRVHNLVNCTLFRFHAYKREMVLLLLQNENETRQTNFIQFSCSCSSLSLSFDRLFRSSGVPLHQFLILEVCYLIRSYMLTLENEQRQKKAIRINGVLFCMYLYEYRIRFSSATFEYPFQLEQEQGTNTAYIRVVYKFIV